MYWVEISQQSEHWHYIYVWFDLRFEFMSRLYISLTMAYKYTYSLYNLNRFYGFSFFFFYFVAALKAKTKLVKRVPKGTSEYQAAWIVDSEEEEVYPGYVMDYKFYYYPKPCNQDTVVLQLYELSDP